MAAFTDGMHAIEGQLKIPTAFSPEVLDEAERVAANPRMPERDATDIPLVTIDPSGSMDLDQAYHAEARFGGFRIHYAIADVAAFVAPGGALDRESFARGVTLSGD